MKDYFYSLLIASVCGSLCIFVSGKGYEKYIRFAVSMICACLVLYPLKDLFAELPSVKDYEYSLPEAALSADPTRALYETAAKDEISKSVFEEFGINASDISINIDQTEDCATVTDISLKLPSGDADEIKSFLLEKFGGNVEVAYE